MELVAEEAQPKYTPHVVGEIGIVELHRPSLLARRKAAKHQQATTVGQKRFKWVTLYHF